MKISDVINNSMNIIRPVFASKDLHVTSIEYDSRKVAYGSLFVAVEGFESDGHSFIESAINKGCKSIIISESRLDDFSYLSDRGISILVSENTRRGLSIASSIFYGYPSKRLHVTGITGTNGKTSITYLLESIYSAAGFSCGVIGTVNYRWKDKVFDAQNTTPESKDIHELLSLMLRDGVTHVILEISSHALELNRADDIELNSAIFTNLTRDHLDFHKTFDAYFNAKKRLFDILERSHKLNKTAVINIDDEFGRKIYNAKDKYSFAINSFALKDGADITALDNSIEDKITGLKYTLNCEDKSYDISLKLAGKFQVYNSLAAFGSAYYSGIAGDTAVQGMNNLQAVPGRLQVVESPSGFYAVIDYAHTSDALLKLLQSIKGMPHEKLITVFGCGGDRDKTKRPIMFKAALEYSDIVIVTSDNPRTEDPLLIIKDIISEMSDGDCIVEPDREKGIALAVSKASRGDIVVIAGKGHEDYQIIGKTKHPFDDREIALKYINERSA
ncbi:MAG: UDP-N-acetylmuramoyl-L-alanyl-D-glutamate--2,6-diaminopimelate ligase [Leptospirales bacterium]|nr:UDP-N-acetylmuramoyl-L-alanyl-D-glutamate--2,6-diaminopimelate ligase [Leptospirales bacterium]